MTVVSLFSFEPTTMLAGASALLLYAIGLIGAQKRNARYLHAYGVVSIVIMVLSVVGTLVLLGVLTAGMVDSREDYHPRQWMPKYGMANVKPHSLGANIEPVSTTLQHGVYAPDLTVHSIQGQTATRNPKFHPELAVLAPHNKRQAVETQVQECDIELTPLGWAMLALASIVGLVMFAVKVKTIALAFRMRRMLLAIAGQRLPVTMPACAGSSAAAAAICSASYPCKTESFVPATRRECERCTFVNAAGPTRCAMCDSPLPLAAAPVQASAVPKIYVAGSYVPMNQI